jgi:hypothetical protein
MTDFYPVAKAVDNANTYKKPVDVTVKSSLHLKQTFKVEEITQKLRGANVKILWMPKRHWELDATQYISVFLLNEISRLVENDEDEQTDTKTKCIAAIDRFPNKVICMKYDKKSLTKN